MGHDLGVGLAGEARPFLQHLPQLAKVFDDAVVNHGDVVGRMRVRVVFGRLAVGGPAGMPDAGMARERLGLEARFEIPELAFGAAALQMVAFQRGDACGNHNRDIPGASANRPVAPRPDHAPECRQCRTCGSISPIRRKSPRKSRAFSENSRPTDTQ